MSNDESGNKGWLFTKRAFYRNGAFALTNPIAFLPQQVKDSSLLKETTETDGPEKSQKLTGEEAKKLYEDIICSNSQLEKAKKTRSNDTKHTPVGRTKNSFTKLRRKSSSLIRHFKSSKKQIQNNPPISVSKLFQSVQCGDVYTLEQALVNGCDVDTRDAYNWSLLMSAAYAGHVPVVQLLLDHGAIWQGVRDQRGLDAVDLATIAGHHDIVEMLSPSMINDCTQSTSPNDSDFSLRSLRKRHHSALDDEYQSSFYCSTCEVLVEEDEMKHNLSTVHQFNSQFHSTDIPYSIPQSNKGYQMMVKRGWNPENGLGPSKQGTLQPIKTVLKRDRQGLGSGRKQKARVTHFRSFDKSAIQCAPVRTRSVARKQDEEKIIPRSSKRARHDALQKDKQWEISMRRYLNTDSDLY